MKTARVTLLVSPEDKRRFNMMAVNLGLTTSELLRQAMNAYDIRATDERGELAALTTELRRAIPGMRKSLRQAIKSADRALANIANRRKKP